MMDDRIYSIISKVITAEGGYVDNPNDKGGPTRFGITEKVARAAGYTGDMRELPRPFAESLYYKEYVTDYGFDKILSVSIGIGCEVIDTGVNMGQSWPIKFLQRSLNLFHTDNLLLVDGRSGPATLNALKLFLIKRGAEGEVVLLKLLNGFQTVRYAEIAEANPTQKDFIYGWIRVRT